MLDNSTIGAISTPFGNGGIGIIRLSGSQSVEITEQMFKSYSGKKVEDLKGYSGMLGEIVKGEETLDQAIVYRYIGPKSYTGEDVVEISCHGGSWVLSQVLRLAYEKGAAPAEAGEFTKRAFLNGKLDLLQAEAVMDVIMAQGNASLKAANELREGRLSTKIQKVVENLLAQAAHLGAWTDYPEEEMEMVNRADFTLAIKEGKEDLNQLLSTYDYGKIIKEGIATAIVGKPNVGKSTLMNLLSGYELSIVSNLPGTTRDVVKEQIRLGDLVLLLADTAGIRKTEDQIEKVGVERAKKQIQGAGLVLALFDHSKELSKEDLELIGLLDPKNTLVLLNKSDEQKEFDFSYVYEIFPHVLAISAKENKGLDELEGKIIQLLGLEAYDQGDAGVLSNERQRQSVHRAREALEETLDALNLGMTYDAVGICLDEALLELLVLTGQKVQDQVVDQVFAQFCVGK